MTETAHDNALLDAYLRDHRAAADAGLALAERCRRSNEGTDLAVLLGDITAEIAADRDSLDRIMTRLGVPENKLKSLASRAAELVARVKSNGVFTHYSPSSRVVELEGLLAGIDAKRSLWASLRTVADERPQLDAGELDELIAGDLSARAVDAPARCGRPHRVLRPRTQMTS